MVIYRYIQKLQDSLRVQQYRYYRYSEQLISDFDYDMLFRRLQKLEELYPDSVTEDSPTQIVGSDMRDPILEKLKRAEDEMLVSMRKHKRTLTYSETQERDIIQKILMENGIYA